MRFLLALLALAGPAEASSIVPVEPMTEKLGPSMVAIVDRNTPHVVAAPAPGDTPSIVALGEPAVADETVAAIPEESPLREETPMVIRGGIVGDAFATPAPTPEAPAEEPEETAAAPEAEQPAAESRPAEPRPAPAPSGPPLGEPE